jgi:hypothetical protein
MMNFTNLTGSLKSKMQKKSINRVANFNQENINIKQEGIYFSFNFDLISIKI